VFIESTEIAELPRQKLEISIRYRLRQQSNWSENNRRGKAVAGSERFVERSGSGRCRARSDRGPAWHL